MRAAIFTRDAANAAVGIDPAAEQHVAGMDADADVEGVVTVRCTHFRAEILAESSRARPQRTARSASSSRASSAPKAAEDAVAGVLQDLAGVGLDDGRAARQGVVHDGADRLRVEVLGKRGGADHVEEQDADLPQGLCGQGRRCRRKGQRRQLGPRGRQSASTTASPRVGR
jgi:hypothetical protein